MILRKKKTRIIKAYKDFFEKAKENTQKLDACEPWLKANSIGGRTENAK